MRAPLGPDICTKPYCYRRDGKNSNVMFKIYSTVWKGMIKREECTNGDYFLIIDQLLVNSQPTKNEYFLSCFIRVKLLNSGLFDTSILCSMVSTTFAFQAKSKSWVYQNKMWSCKPSNSKLANKHNFYHPLLLKQCFPTNCTGTWRRSKWDQKSCQIGIFVTVLTLQGTENVHKTWRRDLRPKRLGTTAVEYCKRYFWYCTVNVTFGTINPLWFTG